MRDDTETDSCTKPFVEHLDDLRKTILWCAGYLAGGICLAIPLAPTVLRLLKEPLRAAGRDPDRMLQAIGVATGFAVAMRVALWGGLILAFPFMLAAIAHFVFPGLTRRERRAVTRGLVFAALLFAGGVWLGYGMTLPVAIEMLFRINAWLNIRCEFVELTEYVTFVLKLLLAFGMAFELPVVVLLLGALGIISSEQLRTKRRHVVVGLLVLAMFLTPQDPITMLMMAVPLIALYEACIWIIWMREKRAA